MGSGCLLSIAVCTPKSWLISPCGDWGLGTVGGVGRRDLGFPGLSSGAYKWVLGQLLP